MAPRWHEVGVQARRKLGVGSAREARSHPHPYTPHGFSRCVACGLQADAEVHQSTGSAAE